MSPKHKRLRISVYTKNAVNPNYAAFRLGADRVGARLNARIDHRVPKEPDDATEQSRLLLSELDNPPDGILFNPANDQVLRPPVARVAAAGVPMVNFINRMEGAFVTFIGADEFRIGYEAARFLLDLMGRRGTLGIIEGPPGAPTSRARIRGFDEAVGECPAVRVGGRACGYYMREGGEKAMRDLVALGDDLDGVIAANDLMALGALSALEATGRTLPIMGSNGTVEAAQAICDGRLVGSVDYDGFKMGCLAATAMLRHLQGVAVPPEILMPATIISRANCGPWLVPVEERPIPDWETWVPGGD